MLYALMQKRSKCDQSIILVSLLLISSKAYSCAEIVQPIFVSLPDAKFFGLDSSKFEGAKVEAKIRVLSTGSIEVIKVLSMEPGSLTIEKIERLIKRAKFIPAKVHVSGGGWTELETEINHLFEF